MTAVLFMVLAVDPQGLAGGVKPHTEGIQVFLAGDGDVQVGEFIGMLGGALQPHGRVVLTPRQRLPA